MNVQRQHKSSAILLSCKNFLSNPASLITLSRLALAYERSRAPNSVSAFLCFLRSQRHFMARLIQLGWSRHLKLVHLEIASANSGLSYPQYDNLAGPPWRLPDHFANLGTSDLPVHPIIEPAWVAQLGNKQSPPLLEAIASLHQLLRPEGLAERWHGVPRITQTALPLPGNARIAVCLHLFYPEVWPALHSAFATIPEPWDLYITVPEFACTRALERIAAEHPAVCFMPCKNRGRDVLPFLRWLELGVFDRYDVVCKLHSKRSLHMQHGVQWFEQLLASLFGSQDIVSKLLERMRSHPQLGLVGPSPWVIKPEHAMHQACNQRNLIALATRAALPQKTLNRPFFAGTMFWFRPEALSKLRALKLRDEDFPIEMAQTDGTPAHAIERLIWPMVEEAGFEVGVI